MLHTEIFPLDIIRTVDALFIKELVLCWNAHDAIQAKADLHDELVDVCAACLGVAYTLLQLKPDEPWVKEHIDYIEQALAKAKKLTGDMT